MTPNETLLLALLVIFALPWALWRLWGKITLPLVVVQIVGGILLGPGVFGAVAPGLHGEIFTPQVIASLNALGLWAVTVFVFIAGLELDISEALANRRETVTAAGFALGVPLVLGTLAGGVLLQTEGWMGAAGHPWQTALGIGMACAVTALPILILFLDQLDLLRRPLGQRILRYASLDDIAIWAVLALILLDWTRVSRQLGFVLILLTLSPLVRRLVPRLRPTDRWPVALVWMIALAFVSDWAGLHFMVGAFLAGAVLEARWFDVTRVDRLREAWLLVMMPVFFLSTGLRTGFQAGGWVVLAAALLLLVASVGGKLLGVWLAGRQLGWGRETWVIGWLLQTKALIMIIFANILLDKEIISPAAFTALLLMAVGSTVLTMPVVTRLLSRPDLSRHRDAVK
ncbi:cation:proton antiporter [Stagnihabitans tardus]|uniref:Cation:proton antiporter n=1 Tax=Stagnihabitans tardus TaxID=2699202 RepID=A0AAE4Y7N3_9RHOB|nr:cation:proton antiporter [Stagnihabitans tardus]NBZ86664.1 cation:proton antiporter [Stagnihabitans tardus]